MDIELYYTHQTRAGRVRWLLEELEIPYTLRPVDLFGGERNPAHPLGAVPSIRIDGMTLIESGAICHWLTDRYPGRGLAPAAEDPLRARYEQWMFFAPGTLEPPAFDILLHSMILPEPLRVPEILPYSRKRLARVLNMLEAELDHDGWLLGERFSSADIMIGSTLRWLPEQLAPCPALRNYIERVAARPAWQRAQQPPETTAEVPHAHTNTVSL